MDVDKEARFEIQNRELKRVQDEMATLLDGRRRLTSIADRAYALLDECASQFRSYEKQHRAKGTPEADEKATVNAAIALKIERFLSTMPEHAPVKPVSSVKHEDSV